MGGGPCRLKQILDQMSAAQRAAACATNTANIAAAATSGEATVTKESAAEFQGVAEAYAAACAKIEAELAEFLPPD